ncbi:phytase [Rubellimicrobium rubrum]|uniref:Phytase n=1 Tax=Rubellimicrobium rubrum TaxID=2585369 RepID=A0A5C4MWN1_9RHOB|nr:phytase [Rubellimicrobium rubrum]TNC50539.1 phytase [Rubellimicrobium rubrum]
MPRDDVEGLAILDGAVRYLVTSVKGFHRAALLRLVAEVSSTCEALLEIAPASVDGVTGMNGLDGIFQVIGPDHLGGFPVVMDDQNGGFTTDFKLIAWDAIARQLP